MTVLVPNAPVSFWTLLNMDANQMAEAFPQTRRFFDAGFVLNRKNHADGVIGLTSRFQDINFNLETGDFQ